MLLCENRNERTGPQDLFGLKHFQISVYECKYSHLKF